MKKNVLLLHNLGSKTNVGAIFRTSDAIGVDKIYLCGYTPAPFDRFGRKNQKLCKASMGAENFVSYEKADDIQKVIEKLKKENFKIIALEQDEKSLDYKKIKIKEKNAFIVGSEVFGIEKEILELCDEIAELPMYGKKNSLNVSVATGIFLYRLLDK